MTQHQAGLDFNPNLKMFGGKWGGSVPILVLIAGLLWLSLTGPATPKNFWSIGLLAIAAGLLFTRTKAEYCAAILRGIADRNGATIIVSWVLASVFGQVMQAGGIIQGLLWLGLNAGTDGSTFTIITFLAAACFAMGTGTASGTILTLTPVMYPAGVYLGADPLMLALAILSGGAFGDCYSPISASNITSALTQGANMNAVTRTRAPLVLAAAAISIVVFAIFGGGGTVLTPPEFAGSMNPKGLIMLIGFATVIFCALTGRHLIESLCYGSLVGIGLGMAIGKITFAQILHVVEKRGASSGLIEDGVNDVTGAILLILFILAIIRVLVESGVMESIVGWAQHTFIKSHRQAEIAILAVTTITTIPISANTPCEVLLGTTFVKPIAERFGIAPERAANLLCCSVCTLFYMLPWSVVCALWFNTVSQTALKYDLQSLSISGAFASPFSWALMLVTFVSASTGWGSQRVAQAQSTTGV